MSQFNERLENKRHNELFRFITDAQDNWMLPSGDNKPPQAPDTRSEEAKEKSRKYWLAQPSYYEIYTERLKYGLGGKDGKGMMNKSQNSK